MATILVVDDDGQIREMLRRILERYGYKVLEAEDGRPAKRMLAQQEIDLVICDLFMPDQDGLQTIRELHKQYPSLPIIATSGAQNWGTNFLEVAEKLGAAATLSKPFLPVDLKALVARLLPAQCSQ
jgi:CheY-like chemotaxis protein